MTRVRLVLAAGEGGAAGAELRATVEFHRKDDDTPPELARAELTVRRDRNLEEIASRLLRQNPSLGEPVTANHR